MNYKIDKTKDMPAYLQLYHFLRQDIYDGVYPYGSKLPSKRTMAAETGVSVITIEHTLELLCEEGYTESRERSGCFVIFRKNDFRENPSAAARNIVPSLESHNGGDFPFSVVAKTMRRVLLDYGEQILVKSPNYGCQELRAEICAYLARSRSIHVMPAQVVIGSGAEYLYGLIAQLFREKGRFALEDPSYDKIRRVYESFGIVCDMLPLHRDGIDSAALRGTSAVVLHTTPFNSFPSGVSVGISKKHEYLIWANERSGIIIEDNYDSEMTISSKPEDSLFAMSGGSDVIYLNTFSKTIAPSIRMGYMILPESVMAEFDRHLSFYSCTVPVFDQYVLAELLRSGDFERHINRIRRKRRKNIE